MNLMITLLPEDIQVALLEYSSATIHVLILPEKQCFVRIEEVAEAIQVSQESVNEFLTDLPKDLKRDYPVLNCQPALIKADGTQIAQDITFVPFELALSFWNIEALNHSESAIRLITEMLIRCAVENLQSTVN